MDYIHYGSKEFKEELFLEIKNRKMFVKPFGGLWASRMTRESPNGEWREWVDDNHFLNEFGQKYGRENFFKFRLKDGAKILRLRDVNQLKDLPKIEDNFSEFSPFVCLDFEKLAKEYDGMEVLLSEETSVGMDQIGEGLYWFLYGWDCNSLLVFNKDVIEII